MNLVKINCAFCGKESLRSRGKFNEAIKMGWKQYCSWECLYGDRAKRGRVFCENCGRAFERILSAVSPHNYCSQSCAAIANNKKRVMIRWNKTKSIIGPKQTKFNKCKRCGKWFRKIQGNFMYCSSECRAGMRRRYTNKQLIEILKLAAQKLERIPTKREMNEVSHICAHFFGSWNNAIAAAGLKPNRSHNQRMYKCACAKAIDGHVCDSISELIIDNWLTENKIIHTRNVPYPKTNHKADWGVSSAGKNIFVEYFGLANDSHRYDLAIKEKVKLCGEYKISLIPIYPKDIYPKKFLEANLKNKFKEFLTA